MSNTLLKYTQQIQTKPDSHPILFERALWELLKLYNENEADEFIRTLAANSGPLIRWKDFQTSFMKEVTKCYGRFTIIQLEEFLDNDCPIIDSFVRTYYKKYEKRDFCCHRDICTLAAFLSKELKKQPEESNISDLQQFYHLTLERMHAFLYGMIAHSLITGNYGFIPQELEDIDEEAEEHCRLCNNDEW